MVPPAGLTNAVGFSLNDAVVSPVRLPLPPAGGGIDFRYEKTSFPSRCDMTPDKIFVSLISVVSESGWLLTNKIPAAPFANAFCAFLCNNVKRRKENIASEVSCGVSTLGIVAERLSEIRSYRMVFVPSRRTSNRREEPARPSLLYLPG